MTVKISFRYVYFCILVQCGNLFSQTTIPSNTSVFGLWTKSSSPYLIKGNISVPKDSVLTIEPGVEVRFDGKFQLSVYGKIKALGKKGDTIRFYPQDTLNRWRGIRFYGKSQDRDSAIFEYCEFENSGPKVTNFESCLRLTQGHFRIANCTFTKNQGVFYSNSISADSILSLEINRCYFINNRSVNTNPSLTISGVSGAVSISKGTVMNSIFENNISRNPYNTQDQYSINGNGSGGTLAIGDYYSPNTSVTITACKFLNNQCGIGGAGISFGLRGGSKIQIRNCHFENNRSGRYGCITSINTSNSTRGNMKLVISKCIFKSNKAANSFTSADAAAIAVIGFSTYDSVIISENIFEKNIGVGSVFLGGMPGDQNYFLKKNVFRNNYSGGLLSNSQSQIVSIGNLYYNNLFAVEISNKSSSNQYYSINDLYAFNGYKVDTFWLDQQLMQTYSGNYYKFIGGIDNSLGTAGVFRNCIFWGNSMADGRIVHLRGYDSRFEELSNCIMQGNLDSTITWSTSVNAPKPTQMALTIQDILNADPIFVRPPNDFGPVANTDSVDFRLRSTCSHLSPAYNKGLNSAYPSLASLNDFDTNPRIACDTVDIGPFEIDKQYKRVSILNQPKDSVYCDNTFSIVLNTTCNPNSSFVWQSKQGSSWSNISSSNTSSFSPSNPQAGLYRAIYKQNDCNIADTSRGFDVSLIPSPKPYLGNDTTIEQKASLVLNPGTYSSYSWQDNSSSPTFTVNGFSQGIGKKIYSVKVHSANGCWGVDSIAVTVTWNSSGESLFQLAKKYNTTIDAIKNSNTNIDWNSPSRSGKKKDWIYKGESIIIPNTYTEDIESFSNYANQTVKASMPDFVWIGLAAHRALKIYILSLNLTNPYRPWYFDRSIAGKFELSRPDVVYDDYVVGGVWECKPLGSIYAKKEAELYARKLNEFRVGRFGVGTTKGAPSPFIGFLPYIDPVTKIMFEFTIDNNSGSIFYTVLYNPYKDPTLKPKFVPFKITLPKDPITIGPKYPLPIFPVPIRSPVPVYNRFGF